VGLHGAGRDAQRPGSARGIEVEEDAEGDDLTLPLGQALECRQQLTSHRDGQAIGVGCHAVLAEQRLVPPAFAPG
jgi:hypothetical protein